MFKCCHWAIEKLGSIKFENIDAYSTINFWVYSTQIIWSGKKFMFVDLKR